MSQNEYSKERGQKLKDVLLHFTVKGLLFSLWQCLNLTSFSSKEHTFPLQLSITKEQAFNGGLLFFGFQTREDF